MTRYIRCSACGAINRVNQEERGRAICGKCKEPLNPKNVTSDEPIAISDINFGEEVLASRVPVLVDFYATWCGACRSLEPALDAVAGHYKGKLKVTKLDIDRNPQNANRYQIRATPTLIVFRDGEPVDQVKGALPERQLDQFVSKYIA
jgi:thioredoxin